MGRQEGRQEGEGGQECAVAGEERQVLSWARLLRATGRVQAELPGQLGGQAASG